MLGGQRADELDDQTQPWYACDQRRRKQHDVERVGQEAEHVIITRFMALPRPNQADAHGEQAADGTHHRLALQQPYDHLKHGQRSGNADGQLQIGGDDEQHHKHDARQHRFDYATRTADGVDHGEVVVIAGIGESAETGTFSDFSHWSKRKPSISALRRTSDHGTGWS